MRRGGGRPRGRPRGRVRDPEVEEYFREKETERLMRAPEGGPVPFERVGPSLTRAPGQRKRGGWRPTDAD